MRWVISKDERVKLVFARSVWGRSERREVGRKETQNANIQLKQIKDTLAVHSAHRVWFFFFSQFRLC